MRKTVRRGTAAERWPPSPEVAPEHFVFFASSMLNVSGMALDKQLFTGSRVFLLILYSFEYSRNPYLIVASPNESGKIDHFFRFRNWSSKSNSNDFFVEGSSVQSIWNEKKTNFLRIFKEFTKPEDHALDGMITLLHLASQIMTKNRRKKILEFSGKDFSNFDFRFEQLKEANMFDRLQEPDIIEKVLLEIEKITENAECAKLIVCKTIIFVEGMQKSLKFFTHSKVQKTGEFDRKGNYGDNEEAEKAAWRKSSTESRFYFFFPSLEQVIEFGDSCDLRFPQCLY